MDSKSIRDIKIKQLKEKSAIIPNNIFRLDGEGEGGAAIDYEPSLAKKTEEPNRKIIQKKIAKEKHRKPSSSSSKSEDKKKRKHKHKHKSKKDRSKSKDKSGSSHKHGKKQEHQKKAQEI